MKPPNDHEYEWLEEEFKHTALGLPFPASCVIEDGKQMWCAIPIRKGAKQNLTLISDLLRSPTPPPKFLAWVADLFDENTRGDFKIRKLHKNGKGAKKSGGDHANWHIAEYAKELIDDNVPRQRAVGRAAEQFKVSERTVESALASYLTALEEHDRITQEQYRK